MSAQSRYYIDDQGQEWFAVCPRTEHHIGIPEPPLYKVDWSLTKLWSPVDQVQITDELACSRIELGPVMVFCEISHDLENPIGELISVEKDCAVIMATAIDTYYGPFVFNKNYVRIATLAELKGVGIE